jgi:hypothetical protein
MKRFIAVLSSLLVLPAFAEVAPVYYDDIIEYNDDAIDEETVVEEAQTPTKNVAQRNTINRSTSASRAISSANTSGASRTNTNSRAIATSPRSASGTSRGTLSRTAKTNSVVSRTPRASRTSVTARNTQGTKPVTARVGTANNPVTTGNRYSAVTSQTELSGTNSPLYNRVGVGNRRSAARISTSIAKDATTTVVTEEDISTTTKNLTALTELTDYCKAQYAACMDNYCNVLDDNQGRCSCSKNLKQYEKTEAALTQATEKFQEAIQKIKYIGLTTEQIESLFDETEAEEAMKSNSDNSNLKNSLDAIKRGIIDISSPKSSSFASDNGLSLDINGLLSADFTSNFDINSFLGMNQSSSTVSNQRGEQLYKTAVNRCRTAVLNSCTAQGIDANVITNSYDLEIDKQCIAYERSLNEANTEMRNNVTNATNILQQARLMLTQKKNSYDLRSCVAALDECMQDEYVCGEDYDLCLDSTGKYISEGKLIAGSMPGVAGGSNVNQTPLSSDSMSSWTSQGMYDLYAVWNYTSGGNQMNAWGAGNDENLNNFIEAIVPNWTSNKKALDMATYLLNKIGTIDSKDKVTGMCASVMKQCQDYTYNNKTYKADNAVIRQYLATALSKIKLKQDSILSDYAENCKSDISSCLNTNGYDTDKSDSSTVNTQAIRACSSQIATCMSVTGYKPSDPSKLTYTQMSAWTSAMVKDTDVTCESNQYLDTTSYSCKSCPTARIMRWNTHNSDCESDQLYRDKPSWTTATNFDDMGGILLAQTDQETEEQTGNSEDFCLYIAPKGNNAEEWDRLFYTSTITTQSLIPNGGEGISSCSCPEGYQLYTYTCKGEGGGTSPYKCTQKDEIIYYCIK